MSFNDVEADTCHQRSGRTLSAACAPTLRTIMRVPTMTLSASPTAGTVGDKITSPSDFTPANRKRAGQRGAPVPTLTILVTASPQAGRGHLFVATRAAGRCPEQRAHVGGR
jgi:hypothetical protein